MIAAPIEWKTVKDALWFWFADATGLPTVIWGDQDTPQPEYPYASIQIISGPTSIGTGDETRITEIDPDPTIPGKALEVTTGGPREMTLSCQVNVGKPVANDPDQQSRAVMTKAQAALGMASFATALRAAGLSVIERLPIIASNIVIGDLFLSRSLMDVRFGLSSNVTEELHNIETVKITAGDPFNLVNEPFGGSTP